MGEKELKREFVSKYRDVWFARHIMEEHKHATCPDCGKDIDQIADEKFESIKKEIIDSFVAMSKDNDEKEN